jgi:HEAT repeat protein
MSFYPEFNGLSLEQLTNVFEGDPAGAVDDPMTFYPDVAIRIAKKGDSGFSYLKRALSGENPDRVVAAIIGLGRAPVSAHTEEIIALFLDDPRDEVVAEAIVHLMAKEDRAHVDKVMAHLHHPSALVVAAVLNYLATLFPERALPVLQGALQHADSGVRWSACDSLEDLGDKKAIESLQPLVDDPDEDVREKAAQSMHFLKTGKYDFPQHEG